MSKSKSKKVRHPSKTYTQCPCCKSQSLIRLNVDALCADCDWTSIDAYIDSGGMDNLFAAHRDHFDEADERSSETSNLNITEESEQENVCENKSA